MTYLPGLCSEACGRNANKVILYEDASKKHLLKFISTLHGCEVLAQACSTFGAILENVVSGRLHYLLTPGTGSYYFLYISVVEKLVYNLSIFMQIGVFLILIQS